MDPAPILGHRDMGMGMDHSMHGMTGMSGMQDMDHSQHNMSSMSTMDHSQHQMGGIKTMDHSQHGGHPETLGRAGFGSTRNITHVGSEFGPHVDMRADSPQSGLNDPGIGLRDHQRLYGRRVLTYADICNLYHTADPREPGREIATPIEVVDRWLAKAGVDSWKQVSAEIVDKCIRHLEAGKEALDKQ